MTYNLTLNETSHRLPAYAGAPILDTILPVMFPAPRYAIEGYTDEIHVYDTTQPDPDADPDDDSLGRLVVSYQVDDGDAVGRMMGTNV